jgi:TonB-dependent starch-binding outer membrane protein SusC
MPAPLLRTVLAALALSVLPLASPAGAAAQARGVVFGMVVDDSDGMPVPGAEIAILGSDAKARADDLGMFVLPDLPAGPLQLRIEKPGYGKVTDQIEVPAGGLADLEVRLLPMAIALRELLVTGKRLRKAGYSVTELSAARDADETAADLLAANVPGVRVAVNRGVAGTSADVAIRGTGTFQPRMGPAIYLDGILISESVTRSNPQGVGALSVLSQIPAREVERIFVLRGPSTSAQYPQADGVIVIETVRGRGR